MRSKIDNLLEAIGQGIVDHALAREKLEAYRKQKGDLEAQINQELIRSALEKKKPLFLWWLPKGANFS